MVLASTGSRAKTFAAPARSLWRQMKALIMPLATPAQRAILQDRTILVLEDEMMIAMLLEDMLGDLGCAVLGPVATADSALALLEESTVNAALLDVNLSHGKSSYPVADALTTRGIPFAFVTGYGANILEPRYRDRPTLQKPFQIAALTEMLVAMSTASGRDVC